MDYRLELTICKLITAVIVCMIGSCSYSQHDKRDKWEKAVSNGADPMVASCALFTQETIEQAACLLLAQNRK
jgi:hypothetical protein